MADGMIKETLMHKSYIWTLPTRVFHWLFALLILGAFLTEDDNLLQYHTIIGYALLILILFRVLWGFFGPKYSKFKDFPVKLKDLKDFFLNIFNKEQKYIGHNPAASFVMLGMFGVILLVIITGILTLGIAEGKGVLSFLNDSFFHEMEFFEEIHEVLANIFLALIFAHLAGILIDKLLHSNHKTLNSIFTGFKQTNIQYDVKLTIFQKLLAFFFLVFFILFLAYNINQPNNIFTASKYKPINYTAQNELFVNECGACHTLYPPHTLPKHSWQIIMDNLDEHFGDDASLLENERKAILSFLIQHNADTSTQEMSYKISKSIGSEGIIAMTQTNFWKNQHQAIPKAVFEHSEVKSKANCKACHNDIEKGLIEDDKIKNIDAFM
jgi:cytochrome b